MSGDEIPSGTFYGIDEDEPQCPECGGVKRHDKDCPLSHLSIAASALASGRGRRTPEQSE